MKYFKPFLGTTIISFILLFLLSFSNSQYELIELDGSNLKVYKDEVTLHNIKNEIIDSLSIKEKIKEYGLGDVNANGQDELVILTGNKRKEYGKQLIVFAIGDSIREIGRKDFTDLNPWKLVIGDIDGDNIDEISLGVYKKSPLHPVMAKRPFIYSFVDGGIHPKWRGSRLSRPFTDYCFYDIDGDGIDEIISIEVLEDDRKIINTYKWKGFGFEGFLESESYDDISNLRLDNGIYINIRDGKNKYKGLMKLVDDKIIIEGMD